MLNVRDGELRMNFSDWYWLAFGAMFVGGEIVLAIREGESGTLSGKLRKILGVNPVKPWRLVGVPAVFIFCIWFFPHIAFGW